ncbi:hypothetical protein VTN77DRAFT_9551 [Rasamsonia byssochlamydoides]|uniref:uncharacterized protein n=1 Tax=Rasamsonia byssochlamydoides TaxID=89139 RepID=UPI0037432849
MKLLGLLALLALVSTLVSTAAVPVPRPPKPPVVLPGVEHIKLNRSEEVKYFHEPGYDDILGHYDSRFYHGVVSDAERVDTLRHMIRAYLTFFRENDLETWIAHGSLLGWWWNGKMLPWDWDIDTQVLDTTLARMATHFNQTVVTYVSDDDNVKRKYLLDVNPWSFWRDQGPGYNIIDARWIDVQNGLYIDITALSQLDQEEEPGVWQCKNFHRYHTHDLYPLRESVYEGVPVKIPYKYQKILVEEYSSGALTRTKFQNHTWFPELEEWVSDF